MNRSPSPQERQTNLLRRAKVFEILDQIGQELELTESQYGRAQNTYEAVANWLAEAKLPSLSGIDVYPQGSIALGTTVRPVNRDEYDVDLIAFAPRAPTDISPETLKKLVGDRLRDNEKYSKILEEKKRCWRLNYKGEFHLDFSPTKPNPDCPNGGELVPDRELKDWHPTNPNAYRDLFNRRAEMRPIFVNPGLNVHIDSTHTEDIPNPRRPKGILRRAVQLLKRHRDYNFRYTEQEIAPISIIITSLAMRSFERCVEKYNFEDELQVLIEIIKGMPEFIEASRDGDIVTYAVWNEATEHENFADRWNSEPERVEAFYKWHKKALSDFESLYCMTGIDNFLNSMNDMFGGRFVDKIFNNQTDEISQGRESNTLSVAPILGLTTSQGKRSTSVPRNDFYGS